MQKKKVKKLICKLTALAVGISVLATPQTISAEEAAANVTEVMDTAAVTVTDGNAVMEVLTEVEALAENEVLTEVEDLAESGALTEMGELAVEEAPIRDRDILLAEEGVKTYKPSEDAYYEIVYEIDSKGVIITGVVATQNSDTISGELILPQKIEGTQVYKIGDKAFYDCDGLYGSIVIPEGVQQIGDYAFYSCNGFMGDLTIGNGVVYVGKYAFAECKGLEGKLSIPDSVVTIDEHAFEHCWNLTGQMPMPEGLVTIGDYAFYWCSGMGNSLKFGRKLKTIGERAFIIESDHSAAVVFYFTSSVTKIGKEAFGFRNSFNVYLHAPKLSYVELYARNNNYEYEESNWEGRLSAEEIKLDQATLSMCPWEQQTISATVLPDTARDKSVIWSSSNENVAKVENGKITALDYGVATISGTTVNGITASCIVTVEDPTIAVSEIKLNKNAITLYVWQESQLLATIAPNDATDKTVTWSSSDNNVATVKDGKVTAVGAGTATITVTASNGMTATCKVVVEKEFPFEDVNTLGWEYAGINYVFQKGLMTGMTTTQFKPKEKLSRSQFATVLYSYAGKPAVTFTNRFSDVTNGQWYSNAVMWAADCGVTSGYANGKFGTYDNITREQFVVMLYKYARVTGKVTGTPSGSLSSYGDYRKVDSWAKEAMIWAVQNGLISGKPLKNGTTGLDPLGNTTRAECATIMMNFDTKF